MVGFARRILLILLVFLATGAVADDYWLESRGQEFSYHPSPEDWRDVNMYQIFTDRFFDGDAGNNNIRGWYTTEGYRHYAMGGDWRGVKAKLPYLAGMGVNAVWISGVQMNAQGKDTRYTPYHAYHPTDFYRAEPQFGTFADLKDLIDTAHSMGIYVILDVVVNHMADLAGLGGGKDDYYHAWGGGDLFWWDNNKRHAWPFDGLQYIHNNGKILNWSDGGQILNGAFVGTDDLKTTDSYVQSNLIDIFKNLIDATDCDGFRVDAIKHVEEPFMMHWANEMRNHAAYRGKSNFILFGENFTYDDGAVAHHCKDQGYAFNSALYFPMQMTLKNVFAYEQGTRQITERRNNLHLYGEGANNLVAFMDNHDVDRIALESGDAWEAKLRPALTFLYTGTPVPCLFYGTEHGFNQGYTRNKGLEDGDYQREVMWNYGYQPGNANGDKFHSSPLYEHIARLNQLRSKHRSLTRGDFTTRWEEGSKGIYAYSRVYGEEEALVIFNTDWSTKSAQPAVGKPDGTVFVNVLDPSESLTVTGGKLNISIGSKGSKIFIAGTAMAVETACDGETLTIRYNPANGPLAGKSSIYIGIGHDGFQDHESHAMTLETNIHVYTCSLAGVERMVDFYFHDNGEGDQRVYDNRNGEDWHVDAIGCRASGAEIAWLGGTHHWPADAELTPTSDIWINTYSEPMGAAGGASVVYSFDNGATWQSVMMQHAGTTENDHDWWHVNIGTFPAGSQIRYAVEAIGALGSRWDNNDRNNYIAQVGEGAGIQWMGNTRNWPTNGAIEVSDSVWIDVESKPAGAAKSGIVVYSPDGGANWLTIDLEHNGANEEGDAWHANIGSFPAYTTVRYAVMLRDEAGAEYWDNNQGNDYLAVVNGSPTAITWFGNVTNSGALRPDIMMRTTSSNRTAIGAATFKEGTVFSLRRSINLVDWIQERSFVGTGSETEIEVELPDGDGPFFYRLDVESVPAGVVSEGEELLVQIETEPVGATKAASVAFSTDGENWQAAPMRHLRIEGNRDVWTAALGTFPAGTTVQYAIELTDVDDKSIWDNNQSQDHRVSID